MAWFSLRNLPSLLWLCYWITSISAASPVEAEPNSRNRILKAATRQADLFRRDTRIRRIFNAELAYVDSENPFQSNEIFASSVRLQSKTPLLVLEDIDHFLEDVTCTGSLMKLRFVSTVAASDALHACDHGKGSYVITSHGGCNAEGERSVFSITDAQLSNNGLSLEMTAVEKSWKEAFRRFSVEFGYTKESHLLRRHRLTRRATSTVSSSANPTITPMSAIAFPLPSGVATNGNATQASFDLAFSTANSTFSIPLPKQAGQLANIPVTAGCKLCTTSGSMVLSQGAFDVDLEIGGENALDLIKSGFVELQANSVAAHIELESTLAQSSGFNITLLTLPVVGFAVPKLGQIGVAFNADVQAAYSVKGGIEVTYGFELTVPPNSSARLDFGNFSNSGVIGFDGTTLNALPFTANISDVEAEISIGFRPTFPVGFSFLNNEVTAQAGLALDLPKLSATITTTSNTDANCQPLNSTNTTMVSNSNLLPAPALQSLVSNIGNMVLIEPAIAVAAAVEAQVDVPANPLPPFQTALQFFSRNLTLPTACLAASSGFQPATKVLDAMTSSYIASVSSVSAASAASIAAQGSKDAGTAGATAGQGQGTPPTGTSAAGQGPLPPAVWGWNWSVCVVALGVVAGGMIML